MFSKKILIFYTLIISSILAVLVLLSFRCENPHRALYGAWKEVSWDYENSKSDITGEMSFERVSDEVKTLTGQELVIHRFETWEFRPDGKLKLSAPGHERVLSWRLKGRGHILELSDGKQHEYYNIMSLTAGKLTVNFDADLELRGIAKLTFERAVK